MKNISRWLFMAVLMCLVACHKSSNSKVITTGTDTTVTVYAIRLVYYWLHQYSNLLEK